jgi:hypothetical protein
MQQYKEELVDDDRIVDDVDEEYAYSDDDAARWLITYLGECFPCEFLFKLVQALDMSIYQGKMDAEYTTAMWSDAGVGVAGHRIIMKDFINFFKYKFTVAESLINQLAPVDSVPPIVGTVQYLDRTLDYWYKDLDVLLTGQIAREHINQPGLLYSSVGFVLGADNGQGSFRAGVKVIFRNAAWCQYLGNCHIWTRQIACAKDTSELLPLALTPKLNSALKRMVSYEQDDNGKLVGDGTLAIYTNDILLPVDGVGQEGSTFHAILDRTPRLSGNDTLVLNVPIHVFITGDLAFYANVVGKEGMDKAHCHWCKLPSL